MNKVFFSIVALAFLFAIINNTPEAVGSAALDFSKTSVELAIGLIGYITLFLGLMKVVEEAGGLRFMARLIRPLLIRLFPSVPPDHPAMGAMVMNISANALGLGNAATPFGLKAMAELNKLNATQGVATNAMALFLAINTSGLALLPTGIIGLRAKFDSVDPAIIFPTTLFATACSTIAGIFAAKMLSRLPMFRSSSQLITNANGAQNKSQEGGSIRELIPMALFGLCLVGLVVTVYALGEKASVWIMPGLIFGMLLVGFVRGVAVYDAFIRGAKEGFQLGVMIIPYLVAILCAIGMFRMSGGLKQMVSLISPLTDMVNMPGEVLPLALLRPMSGSGAFGITSELLNTHGPDSYIGQLASTMTGSTETTFYVLAVYFGSVGIVRYRHALLAGITADFFGVVGSLLAVNLLIGPPDVESDSVVRISPIRCEGFQPVFPKEDWRVAEARSIRIAKGDGSDLKLQLFPGRQYQVLVCSKPSTQIRQVDFMGTVVARTELTNSPVLSLDPELNMVANQWNVAHESKDYHKPKAIVYLLEKP